MTNMNRAIFYALQIVLMKIAQGIGKTRESVSTAFSGAMNHVNLILNVVPHHHVGGQSCISKDIRNHSSSTV